MDRRILIFCCVLIVLLTQSGCIGMVVLSPEECKNETPRTDINDFFADSTPTPPSQISPYFLLKTPKLSPTKTDFLKDWGKPDIISTFPDNKETWIYKRNLWCGVIPALILPIPLILPLCDGFDRIEFIGNEATRLNARHIVPHGGFAMGAFFYGYVYAPNNTFAEMNGVDSSACRSPLGWLGFVPPKGIDSDASKPAVQVTP
jgi:hypothetical protein